MQEMNTVPHFELELHQYLDERGITSLDLHVMSEVESVFLLES